MKKIRKYPLNQQADEATRAICKYADTEAEAMETLNQMSHWYRPKQIVRIAKRIRKRYKGRIR